MKAEMRLYNTLTRKLETFKPIKKGQVGVYSCGPTVYWNQHIGHMYAYIQWDSLIRVLQFQGLKTKWVMNFTDVGHLTSDEDTGDDKMEKGAKREGLTVWEVADKYIAQFLESVDLLNINRPDVLCRVTEHIEEQINMIKKIEVNGFTYKTKTGLVFDTSKFADYAQFARLDLEKQQSGARVEVDPEKKQPWDFLLWVTNQPKHVMQWDSPWGRGFPGWHIECTAMSTKYLGEKFDIHTGGTEHIGVHHTNEIAQGYGAFGDQTANFWLHNGWLILKGKKVSKSLGNMILVTDLTKKGYDPMALRYLILTSHYRKGLNFTWKALEAAQVALARLKDFVRGGKGESGEDTSGVTRRGSREVEEFRKKFLEAINNDLNMPQALAVVWEVVKDGKLKAGDKKRLILDWDKVLGLELEKVEQVEQVAQVDKEIKELVKEREKLREQKKWKEADGARKKIEDKGWKVEDTEEGVKLRKI